MMLFPITSALDGFRKGEFHVGQNTRRWVEAMRRRPAYKRAVKRREDEEAKIMQGAPKL